jgi:hypothetical protein
MAAEEGKRRRQFRGTSKASLEKAMESAANKALKEFRGPVRLKVVEIWVRAENPITEYGVLLSATGG